MAEHRLNDLCIMSVERELKSSSFLENINPVLDKFANMKNRRANLLNKLHTIGLVNFSKVMCVHNLFDYDIYFAVNFSLV
jgi:hypothetical protein